MSQFQDEIALARSELGKKTTYDFHYNPKKLFPIQRTARRAALGILEELPFCGYDFWNHYEVSWLNAKGKPIVAIAEITYNCDSPNIIESKSMKLYFNSFNNTQFKDEQTVMATLKKDLENAVGASVDVRVIPLHAFKEEKIARGFPGQCLDELDILCANYTVDPGLLKTETNSVEETVYSDLLKSNCLVTGQPDWGSVQISYKGKKINHASLLSYIISFRDHTEFGEHCIERMFMDIKKYCRPDELTMYIRYTRRGGLDINFCRSTKELLSTKQNIRLCRQ